MFGNNGGPQRSCKKKEFCKCLSVRSTQCHRCVPDGHIHHGPTSLYYQPFSTTVLLKWQRHTPPYSEKLQGMIHLMETIFRTHRLVWDDIVQLLLTLFSTEERPRSLQRHENGAEKMHQRAKWILKLKPGKLLLIEDQIGTSTLTKVNSPWKNIECYYTRPQKWGLSRLLT